MATTTVTTAPRTIQRGLAFEFRFQWLDADEDPIPLNGDPLIFAYRDASDDDQGFTALYEIELDDTPNEDGSEFVTESAGQYLLTLTNAHTAAIEITDGNYWVRRRIDDDPAHDQHIFGGPLRVRNP